MGKNKKKKESYYDADQSGKKFGKWNFIMLAVIIVIEAVLYYVLTPTINLHSVEFWIWMIVTVVALFICTLNLKAEQMDDMPVSPKLAPESRYADNAQSFSCNEITIYWNSPLIYLLSGLGNTK